MATKKADYADIATQGGSRRVRCYRRAGVWGVTDGVGDFKGFRLVTHLPTGLCVPRFMSNGEVDLLCSVLAERFPRVGHRLRTVDANNLPKPLGEWKKVAAFVRDLFDEAAS